MNERARVARSVAALAVYATLTACGGGGGGADQPAMALSLTAEERARGGQPTGNGSGRTENGPPANANLGVGNGRGNGNDKPGKGQDPLPINLGDDVYSIQDNPNFPINEFPDGGTDTVRTWVAYTLPSNVENLVVTYSNLLSESSEIRGNELNNIIQTNVHGRYEMSGLAGNDVFLQLTGAVVGSYALMDGGEGDDTFVPRGATITGGIGADTTYLTVQPPYGSLFGSGVTITDFNPNQGDTIIIPYPESITGEYLIQNNQLKFDAASGLLSIDLKPGVFGNQTSVILEGFKADDLWLIAGTLRIGPAYAPQPRYLPQN